MISKELLSEVLVFNSVDFTEHLDGKYDPCLKIYYTQDADEDDCHSGLLLLNIYELAHKCKEWAFKNKFIIQTGFTTSGDWTYTILEVRDTTPYIFEVNVNWGITEPEAIFKACQWILENKGKK